MKNVKIAAALFNFQTISQSCSVLSNMRVPDHSGDRPGPPILHWFL